MECEECGARVSIPNLNRIGYICKIKDGKFTPIVLCEVCYKKKRDDVKNENNTC